MWGGGHSDYLHSVNFVVSFAGRIKKSKKFRFIQLRGNKFRGLPRESV